MIRAVEHEVPASPDPSDAELLGRAREDPEAFGRFYDRHVDAVTAFLARRTADPEVAADLASETFVQAYVSRRKFNAEVPSARPWLLGIARRKLLETIRRGRTEAKARARLGFETPPCDEDARAQIESLADTANLREELRAALSELSPALAEAVYLRVGLELSYDQVAARLQCSRGAARVRVMRGLTQLRDLMEVT
jgi:RNA polymerase sigma-70 factor (ECF subfamily)